MESEVIYQESNAEKQTEPALKKTKTTATLAIVLGIISILVSVYTYYNSYALSTKIIKTQTALQTSNLEIEQLKKHTQPAILDPTAPGSYSIAYSQTGAFLVSINDAKPYLNGYKVNLSIGNLSTATYSGIKINSKWGKGEDAANMQSKETSLTQDIAPGTWNKVDLILAPVKASEFNYLSINIEEDEIQLLN